MSPFNYLSFVFLSYIHLFSRQLFLIIKTIKFLDLPALQTTSRTCTPSSLYRQLLVPQIGQLDTALINDLECEAQRMATSIDNLIENLCGILHSVSWTKVIKHIGLLY